MSSDSKIAAVVLGGTGYVGGEFVRLLASHPTFQLQHVVSGSEAGNRIDTVFPHLTGLVGDQKFSTLDQAQELTESAEPTALFSALPHGESAPVLDRLLAQADNVKVVDVSADFRFSDPEAYAAVYRHEHPAPSLLKKFSCSLPDAPGSTPLGHIAHPGCFVTCVTLPLTALFALGLIKPHVQVSAVTGSTGSGRRPVAGTHHPHRHGSMWAYSPLTHRHAPEMESLLKPYCPGATLTFVPHSGPFARGIHATMFAQLTDPASAEDIADQVAAFYSGSPFISVSTRMPSLKEVVGSNRCHIGIAVQGDELVVTSVIDNLLKGAAGGAVQWMNRLFDLDQSTGLTASSPGWM